MRRMSIDAHKHIVETVVDGEKRAFVGNVFVDPDLAAQVI